MTIRTVPATTAKRKTTAAAVDPSIQAGQAGPSESQAGRFTLPTLLADLEFAIAPVSRRGNGVWLGASLRPAGSADGGIRWWWVG